GEGAGQRVFRAQVQGGAPSQPHRVGDVVVARPFGDAGQSNAQVAEGAVELDPRAVAGAAWQFQVGIEGPVTGVEPTQAGGHLPVGDVGGDAELGAAHARTLDVVGQADRRVE